MRAAKQVLAIDAGTRNFAYCMIDTTNWRKPLLWQHEMLWRGTGKPSRREIVRMTREWAQKHQDDLRRCDVIALERQMRDNFIIMNTVIETLYFDKTVTYHPTAVGHWWKQPRRREEKKAEGIVRVRELSHGFPVNSGKIDDLADAWLLAVYALVQSNGLPREALTKV